MARTDSSLPTMANQKGRGPYARRSIESTRDERRDARQDPRHDGGRAVRRSCEEFMKSRGLGPGRRERMEYVRLEDDYEMEQ